MKTITTVMYLIWIFIASTINLPKVQRIFKGTLMELSKLYENISTLIKLTTLIKLKWKFTETLMEL